MLQAVMQYSTDDDETSSNFTCSSIEIDGGFDDLPINQDTETIARTLENFKPKMQPRSNNNHYKLRKSSTPTSSTQKNAKPTKNSRTSGATPTAGASNSTTPSNPSSSSNELIVALNKNMQEMSLLREQIGNITI